MPNWTAEEQILIDCWNARNQQPLRPQQVSQIVKNVGEMFQLPATSIVQTINELISEGRLIKDSDGIRLDQTAAIQAQQLQKEIYRQDFEESLVRLFKSNAHKQAAAQIYGTGIHQLNMVDQHQLRLLCEQLALQPSECVADLGCATGRLAEHLSDRYKVHVTGLDLARTAIESAQKRTKDKYERLRFVVGDLNDIQLSKQSFDVVLSIDTLYFVSDISKVVGQLLQLLRPNGRAAIFWSEHTPDADAARNMTADQSVVGQAIKLSGCHWQSWDLTDQMLPLWERTVQAYEDLESQFLAEGNIDLWQSLSEEAARTVVKYRQHLSRRYLYLLTP